jgi:hypothetical protein
MRESKKARFFHLASLPSPVLEQDTPHRRKTSQPMPDVGGLAFAEKITAYSSLAFHHEVVLKLFLNCGCGKNSRNDILLFRRAASF